MRHSEPKIGRGIRRPPVDYDPEIAELADSLLKTLKLGEYEGGILRVLLASSRPLCAGEVANLCTVPRTKTYHAFIAMVKRGLATEYVIAEEDLEKPDIWEWWGKKNRRAYLSRHNVGVQYYTVNLPYLKSLYDVWCADFQSRQERVGKLLDLLEKRAAPKKEEPL